MGGVLMMAIKADNRKGTRITVAAFIPAMITIQPATVTITWDVRMMTPL